MAGLVEVGDTRLFVNRRGEGPALVVLHGGPGADHTQLLQPLSPLAEDFTLYFVDQRAQGRSDEAPRDTWTIHHAANDVTALAHTLDLRQYAVLGHSYGGIVALQHAVDYPAHASASVVSHAVPSVRWYRLREELDAFQPRRLREQVRAAWEELETVADPRRAAQLFAAQAPFHFKDPFHPAVEEMRRIDLEEMVHTPEVNRYMSRNDFGGFDVEDRLEEIIQPMLIIAGRVDRVCPLEASSFMYERAPGSELAIFEESGHASYLEEPERYMSVVRGFLHRHLG